MVSSLLLAFSCLLVTASSILQGIPTVPFTATFGTPFSVDNVRCIAVDPFFASARDETGWTLIPPSLQDFANTFADDLSHLGGHAVRVEIGQATQLPSIYLTIGNNTNFTDVAGRYTAEAYQIDVESDRITITGASPLGVWWGTRSVLQQAILHKRRIQTGSGIDAPGWNTRGIMLDGGRHYYPPGFIVEMCSWISFWKQNIFHLHLSDNLYNNVDIYGEQRQLDLYARFRLLSDDPAVAGLNTHANESYTRQDFDHMQSSCAARGVTIIPEIEAPGHALVISQWKPELGLSGHLDLLNISQPDSIPTMKTIWDTFNPWFHSKVVHIGADEYVDSALSSYELGEQYNLFVNSMNQHMADTYNKSIRIWGTYPPQSNYTNNIDTNVTVQHWEYFEDNPLFDYIKKGYNVINSDDHTYIVQKYSTSYPQSLNRTYIFHGDPLGGAFAPNIFDPNNATNNPPRNNPYVVGHLACQWNDYGYNTSTYLEVYSEWRDLLPALADKQWGGNLQDIDYDQLFASLQPFVPAQNLDRTVPSKTSTILEYAFYKSGEVLDHSGNGYNAHTTCNIESGAVHLDRCQVDTPLTSKGHNFTLAFSVKQTSTQTGPLFSGPDSQLVAGNGTSSSVMLLTAGFAIPLNYSLPISRWVDAQLIGRGNRTFFSVDGEPEMEFLAKIGINGESFEWVTMDVAAPLKTIGGNTFEGYMRNITLSTES